MTLFIGRSGPPAWSESIQMGAKLTFWVLGVGLLLILAASRPSQSIQAPDTPNGDADIRFELLSEGRLGGKDLVSGSFHNYKSNDGVSLTRTMDQYASATRAREQVQWMLGKAVKVIERGPKGPNQGKREGERIVFLWRRWKAGAVEAVVLWTDGPELYLIQSVSLRHVLAFEKQYYTDWRPLPPKPAQRPPLPLPVPNP